jgi:hypothetical protein
MPVLAKAFLSLVSGDLLSLSLLSAWHRSSLSISGYRYPETRDISPREIDDRPLRFRLRANHLLNYLFTSALSSFDALK